MSEMMVPDSWHRSRLGSLCRTVYRYPTFYGMKTHRNGVPVLRGEHLLDSGKISTDWHDFNFVSEDVSDQYPRTQLEPGDVVMAVRGTVGKFAKVGIEHANAQISPNLIRLSPDNKKVVSDFFFHSLFSVKNRLLNTGVSATGVPALNASDIKDASILCPPLPEQKKIAAILTSVDEVIEKTEAQIQKLEDLKKATMNELLTKGIGHTEFKDSPVGRIPKAWDCENLEHYTSFISYGFTNPMPESDKGPFMITAKDVVDEAINFESARRTTDAAFANDLTDKSRPQINDVLVTKDGTLGRIAIVDRAQVCINQSVAVLRPNDRVRSKFLLYLLASRAYQQRMIDDAGGSTIKHIYITRLAKMPVAIPEHAEQDEVVAAVESIDRCLDLQRRKARRSRFLKKSLMQDLLTGKVRVPLN